jgi:hypothetical protein
VSLERDEGANLGRMEGDVGIEGVGHIQEEPTKMGVPCHLI